MSLALAVAVVGIVVLAGLAVTIGIVERRSAEQAFRSIAARRRENWQERRRLADRASDLDEWERALHEKQQQLDRLERRIQRLEGRTDPPDGGDEGEPDERCEIEDEWEEPA